MTVRRLLLDDRSRPPAERVLTREDLRRAETLALCIALRGALPARIIAA